MSSCGRYTHVLIGYSFTTIKSGLVFSNMGSCWSQQKDRDNVMIMWQCLLMRISTELSDLFFNFDHAHWKELYRDHENVVRIMPYTTEESKVVLIEDAKRFLEIHHAEVDEFDPGVTPEELADNFLHRL